MKTPLKNNEDPEQTPHCLHMFAYDPFTDFHVRIGYEPKQYLGQGLCSCKMDFSPVSSSKAVRLLWFTICIIVCQLLLIFEFL